VSKTILQEINNIDDLVLLEHIILTAQNKINYYKRGGF
jgi:hypothetical protein